MFTPEQLEALQSARNFGKILLVLCVQPSLPVFSAFVSPFYSGKHCASPNRREKLFARRDVYLSIVSKARRLTSVQAEQLLQKKFPFEVFANYLKCWNDRWHAIEMEDIMSLVVLLDRRLEFSIDFNTVISFCRDLDETFAKDRSSPSRAVHSMILRLLDECHDAAGSEGLMNRPLKALLQRFIHHLHSKHVPILSMLVAQQRRVGSLESLPLISLLQGLYAQQAFNSPELTEALLATNANTDAAGLNGDITGGTGFEQEVTGLGENSLLSPLRGLAEESTEPEPVTIENANADQASINSSSVLTSQSVQQLRQKLESFELASRQLAEQLQDSDEQLKDSALLWQQLEGMERQVIEARQLLSSPNNGIAHINRKPAPSPFPLKGDDGSVMTFIGLSTIEGEAVERPSTPSNLSVASSMTAASHAHSHGGSSNRILFNTSGHGRRFLEASSLSLALTNPSLQEEGCAIGARVNTSGRNNNNSRSKNKNKGPVSPQRLLRFPIRHGGGVNLQQNQQQQQQSNLDNILFTKVGDTTTRSQSAQQRREKERAVQAKHGLSLQVPLMVPKKAVNLQIIKSPHGRQLHGNRNIYDQTRFAWMPSKGCSGDPTIKNKPLREERFQTSHDLRLGREMFSIAHY